jgi:hypothetical protein
MKKEILLITLLFLNTLAAKKSLGPIVAVDLEKYDAGEIKVTSDTVVIKHIFKIKNTGDSVLVIQDARPGCGCTVVKYDTLIPSGKEGNFNAEVTLSGIHGGTFTKCINVTTNAKNKRFLQLCVNGNLKVPISVTPGYVQFTILKSGILQSSILLNSEKEDLKILDIYFYSKIISKTQNKKDSLIRCSFKTERSREANENKEWSYHVNININNKEIKETRYGHIIIRTNHPDAPSIKIPSMFFIKP